MLTCEYYQNYKGPLLVSASLDNVDITEKLKGIYGVNRNWQGYLWKYKDAFGPSCIDKSFRVDFIGEDGRKHWFNGMGGDPEQTFNPPLASPFNQNTKN